MPDNLDTYFPFASIAQHHTGDPALDMVRDMAGKDVMDAVHCLSMHDPAIASLTERAIAALRFERQDKQRVGEETGALLQSMRRLVPLSQGNARIEIALGTLGQFLDENHVRLGKDLNALLPARPFSWASLKPAPDKGLTGTKVAAAIAHLSGANPDLSQHWDMLVKSVLDAEPILAQPITADMLYAYEAEGNIHAASQPFLNELKKMVLARDEDVSILKLNRPVLPVETQTALKTVLGALAEKRIPVPQPLRQALGEERSR